MTTHFFSVTFDWNHPAALAQFWAEALGWHIVLTDPRGTGVAPTQGPGVLLVFVPVPERKAGKNRIHIDLASKSEEDQSRIVERLLMCGATHVDIGQGDVPWAVLADPEGNELCDSPQRNVFGDRVNRCHRLGCRRREGVGPLLERSDRVASR